MKTLILVLFLSTILSVTASAQTFDSEPEKQSFISSIIDKVKEGAVSIGIGLVIGLFAKNGWTLLIKKMAGKASAITKEIGETFIGGSNFFKVLEKSIKNDGNLEENSIKEILAAGKEVVAEANDVIISIRPKI